jgi:hypothetical protein
MAIDTSKKQLIPFTASLAIFFIMEICSFYPRLFLYLLAISSFILILSVWILAYKSKQHANWAYYGILPLFLSVSSAIYGVLLSNNIYWHLLLLCAAILNYVIFRFLFFYFEKSEMYSRQFMNNFFSSAGFLVIFFASSSIFGFISFFNMAVWPLLFLLVLIAAIVLFQYYLSYEINRAASYPYILLVCLIMLEISWSISFLPLNYSVSGLVISIFYYISSGLSRYYIQGGLSKAVFKFYLSFAGASIIILLITSSWK